MITVRSIVFRFANLTLIIQTKWLRVVGFDDKSPLWWGE